MKSFEPYLTPLEPIRRSRVEEILGWVVEEFPELKRVIKWNQPMFTHHGTYIIGMSAASKHVSIAPEPQTMAVFHEAIEEAGYSQTSNLFRITHQQPIEYALLRRIIAHNLAVKAETTSFWQS